MKKLVTIALLAAMLLSCFAGCAMQKGEIDVEAYAGEANYENAASAGYAGKKTSLDADASVYSGKADQSWYNKDDVKKEYVLTTADQVMGLLQVIKGGQTFAGVTFYLDCDVDMNGADVTERDSAKTFNGIFDGQGHAIGNWKLVATGGGRAFFSSIADGAVIKDVSFIDATITETGSKKYRLGSVVARAIVSEGQTVTISNVYSSVNFVDKSKTTYIIGGILGQKEGAGSLVVENCEYAGNLECYGASGGLCSSGGIVGKINEGANITVKNCVMTGSVYGKSGGLGGIVGHTGTVSGKLNIENCVVTGNVKSDGSQVGGIIGRPTSIKGGLTIDKCLVNSVIDAGALTGGVVGYIANDIDVKISDCDVAGTLKGHRTTGGIIGTLDTNKPSYITNCEVIADVEIMLDDEKNNAGGGLIGKVDGNSAVIIDGCAVNSDMKVTFAPKAPSGDMISGAGGLIGRVYSASEVSVTNTTVAGEFEFITAGNTYVDANGAPLKFNVGQIVGSSDEDSLVRYYAGAKNITDYTPVMKYTGSETDFVLNDKKLNPHVYPVGYQTKVNEDGTYDLRYVIAAKDCFSGLGVKAEIRYMNENGVSGTKYQTFYVDTAYTYVMDEDANLYAAEDYGCDYLYTLVVSGVPAEYNFDAENLQVILKTFGSNNVDGAIITHWGGILAQGKSIKNTNAQNMGIDIDNFSTTLDEKFVAEDAIFIPGDSYDKAVSIGLDYTKASQAECSGEYGPDAAEPKAAPYHYYLNGDLTSANKGLLNITYNFRVTEAGWYDICIDMRMKGAKEDSTGPNQRNSLLLIDWAAGSAAYDISFNLEEVKDIKTDSAGSYMTGVKVYLEAGEHTISFTSNEGFNNNNYHVRNIYLALAD